MPTTAPRAIPCDGSRSWGRAPFLALCLGFLRPPAVAAVAVALAPRRIAIRAAVHPAPAICHLLGLAGLVAYTGLRSTTRAPPIRTGATPASP